MKFLHNLSSQKITASLILLNLIFKILYLDSQSIAFDEPFSIYIAQMPLSDIFIHLKSGNNPPLWEFILHFWIKIFGVSAFSVRFLPFLFSSFTVALIFKTGDKFFNRKVGLIASLIFTFSNYHVHFSHEARVYALFALLTSVSVYAFLNIINKKERTKFYSIVLVISNALLLYSHYFSLFVISVQLIVIFIVFKRDKKVFKKLLILEVIAFLFFIPYYPVIFNRFIASSTEGTWIQPPQGIYSIIDMLRNFTNEEYGQKTLWNGKPVITLLFLVILTIGFIKFIYRRKLSSFPISHVYVFLSFVIPFTLMFFVSFFIPMFYAKYLIFLTITYFILLAVAVDFVFDKSIPAIILAVVCIFAMVITSEPNVDNKIHSKEAIAKLKELKNDSSVVVCLSPDFFDMNFVYYWDIECFKNFNTVDLKMNMRKCLKENNIYPINNILEMDSALYSNREKIIFFDAAADFSAPENGINLTLSRIYPVHTEYKYPQIFTINVYSKNINTPAL